MPNSIRLVPRLFILLALAAGAVVARPLTAFAQTGVTQLTQLDVELWPDYDRPAMLVLLSGTLPENTPLPATITIPLPENADIHAVARVGDTGGLLSDVEFTADNGQLTLTTPSPGFRVEYYVPYEVDGSDFSYQFNWLSDLAIDAINTVVQQPLAATAITISPTPESAAADRGDGLQYHRLPVRSVGPGEPYTVDVAYTVDMPVLSAPSQPPVADTGGQTGGATNQTTGGTGALSGISPWWLLIIVGVVGLVGAAWYIGRQQGGGPAARARKPQPVRPAKAARPNPGPASANPGSGKARFCHNCGEKAQPADRFCRNCGTQLKSG